MSSEHNHIDFEQIKAYVEGRLSPGERHALEKKALDDPMLQDAIDGYAEFPEGVSNMQNLLRGNRNWRKGTAGRSVSIIILLSLTLAVIYWIKPEKEKDNLVKNHQDSSDSIFYKEIEIVPEEIETLLVVTKGEEISADLLSEPEQKSSLHNKYDYDTAKLNETIFLDEQDQHLGTVIDKTIYPEENDLNLAEYVPGYYLFYLFVVDYRRVKRDNDKITYTKFELSGTSAEFENEETMQNRDLIEKEVEVPYFEYLRTSMEYFSNGDYKKALKRFNIIVEQYPSDANGLFYGGLCYYNLGQFEKGLDYFNRLLKNNLPAFKEEAKWLKVKCLIKLKRESEALNLLDEIIIDAGFYQQDAMKLRKELVD